mgnify:FL=1
MDFSVGQNTFDTADINQAVFLEHGYRVHTLMDEERTKKVVLDHFDEEELDGLSFTDARMLVINAVGSYCTTLAEDS